MSIVSSLVRMFSKKRNLTMARNNYIELHKVTLVEWVDKVLL
jgi:hypothetical protein